ncbi:hypothetical protein [Afipia sp. GAS231]|uniref:AMP-binding enzyme n=1 Tax=Afipia sp. GAS231 TaxID=1882747 RepID=UPI000B88A45C
MVLLLPPFTGENPIEIGNVLQGHAAVLDCIVVARQTKKWGEAVTAVVQLKPGKTVEAEVLIALCKERLGSAKAPQSVEFRAELLRGAVGKLLGERRRPKQVMSRRRSRLSHVQSWSLVSL